MDNLILKFLKYEEVNEFMSDFFDIPFPGIRHMDLIEELYLDNPINSIIQIHLNDTRIGYIVQEFIYNETIYLYYGLFEEYRNRGFMKESINVYLKIIENYKLNDKIYENINVIEADCMDLVSYNVLKSNGFIGEADLSGKMWNMKYVL